MRYWPTFAWTFQKGQNGITIVFAFGLPFVVYWIEPWTKENNIKGLKIVDKFGKQHWELDGNQLKTIWNTLRTSKIQNFLQTHLWSYVRACWFTSLIHGSVFFWCMEFIFWIVLPHHYLPRLMGAYVLDLPCCSQCVPIKFSMGSQ